MNTEEYKQVQELFSAAIRLSELERTSFVQASGYDASIRDEVLSLLGYHNDVSLITHHSPATPPDTKAAAQVTRGMQSDPQTTDLVGPAALSVGGSPTDESSELIERFTQSTNHLLQARLVSATILLSVISILITLVAAFAGELSLVRLAVRLVTIAIFALVGTYLHRNSGRQHRILRRFELIIIAAPLLELFLIQWTESTDLLVQGRYDKLDELRAIASTAVAVYIAVYGLFIPANWRRTALVTSTMACLPTICAALHWTWYEYPPDISGMYFINPTLTLMMAMVATVAAGFVYRVRRQAEAARYYGKYRLVREIGRGAMGIVYEAEHQMLKRPAAIKLIHPGANLDPFAISQFEREVQATATLSHWNTVQIFDYGTTSGGDFYYVMELLKGVALRDHLRDAGPFTVEETLKVLLQVCDGLREAHQKQLVHRDIKPANIFLAEVGGISGVVKILDFGLVATNQASNSKGGTAMAGTPAYMSPEQIRGEPLDGRSDIYSIGCVVAECLTGNPPFPSLTLSDLLAAHLFQTPDLTSRIDMEPRVVALLEKCLAKDPRDRFQSVEALSEETDAILAVLCN